MAKAKTGLNYYAVDTDRYQDLKIKRLKKKFGCPGMVVYDYILCEIYRDKGCYMEWSEDMVFDIAEYFTLTEDLVNEIVSFCASIELFNAAKLKQGIVTSRSIQERYIDYCQHAKRKNVEIPKSVIIPEESEIIPEESEIIPEESEIIPEESEIIPEESEIIPENSGRLPRREEKRIERIELNRIERNNPPPLTPPPYREVASSSGGGGGSFKNIYEELCKIADVREDVYDAVAITGSFTNHTTPSYQEWLKLTEEEQQRGFPLNRLNQAIIARHKDLKPDYTRWHSLCWVKDNCLDSEWRTIYTLVSAEDKLFELQKLVKECKKGKITMPGRFIIKHLSST